MLVEAAMNYTSSRWGDHRPALMQAFFWIFQILKVAIIFGRYISDRRYLVVEYSIIPFLLPFLVAPVGVICFGVWATCLSRSKGRVVIVDDDLEVKSMRFYSDEDGESDSDFEALCEEKVGLASVRWASRVPLETLYEVVSPV